MQHDLFFKAIQTDIYKAFSPHEPQATFLRDAWESPLGTGLSMILEGGEVIEKAGINFSQVSGTALPQSASARHPEWQDCPFKAVGVSAVLHPRNPYVPTSHFNVRLLTVEPLDHPVHSWVGGGFDLTPYYGFKEDCILWHEEAKRACDPFGTNLYAEFKMGCDRYFYLKHRKEARGIGGLFFDDQHEWDKKTALTFLRKVADAYISAYATILERRKNYSFGKRERDFQAYRRGRYVEFNLLYDRGTLFGLQSGGRAESILMSLPPLVKWRYDWHPEPGSPEENLYTDFLPPRDWIKASTTAT